MKKSDEKIHRICIRSIKRSTIKPYHFNWTKFYENKKEFEFIRYNLIKNYLENELPICSVVINEQNWSLLTTQRIITMESSNYSEMSISESSRLLYGDFKGYEKQRHVFGEIESKIDGQKMNYFIETGSASMVMIYGIQTIYQIQ